MRRRWSYLHLRGSGFTLLELVLVMLLLTIIMATAAPSLSNFARGRKSKDAAQNIVALARYARAQAISEGVTHRLHVNVRDGSYWITRQEGGEFVPMASDFGQHFKLPEGVHMETDIEPRDGTFVQGGAQSPMLWSQPRDGTGAPAGSYQLGMGGAGMMGAGGGPEMFVEFYPSGRTEAAIVRLTDADGDVTDIGCTSPTEAFHVIGEEESQGR
jgi:prepilin-type N-terminal cleavage/methylation domain-containing protein